MITITNHPTKEDVKLIFKQGKQLGAILCKGNGYLARPDGANKEMEMVTMGGAISAIKNFAEQNEARKVRNNQLTLMM